MEYRLDLLDLDMGAIANPPDKIDECQYFLDLASNELDSHRFRWQISAFLGAAYSFFEISAVSAYNEFTNPQTGESVENTNAIGIIKNYVYIDKPRPKRINTCGIDKKTQAAVHEITKQLYELRNDNTHNSPLLIMAIGTELPEAFHFCKIANNGTLKSVHCQPALVFCRDAMLLIRQVQKELQVCF
jgi:hypothetical protein